MAKYLRTFTLLIAVSVFIMSCSTAQDGPSSGPVGSEAESAIISNCDGLVGSYETAGPRPLEEAPPGEPFSAWLLAFTPDGTVLWKYSPNVIAGTFTCRDNLITATFTEGTRTDFDGVFDPESLEITIEDMVYYQATEE